jgi:hypothetical protein
MPMQDTHNTHNTHTHNTHYRFEYDRFDFDYNKNNTHHECDRSFDYDTQVFPPFEDEDDACGSSSSGDGDTKIAEGQAIQHSETLPYQTSSREHKEQRGTSVCEGSAVVAAAAGSFTSPIVSMSMSGRSGVTDAQQSFLQFNDSISPIPRGGGGEGGGNPDATVKAQTQHTQHTQQTDTKPLQPLVPRNSYGGILNNLPPQALSLHMQASPTPVYRHSVYSAAQMQQMEENRQAAIRIVKLREQREQRQREQGEQREQRERTDRPYTMSD